MVTGSIQFLAPSLALHLRQYGYTPEFISLCFCIPSLLYASLSPLMYLLTARVPKRLVIILGVITMALGMFFVGTSKLFGFANDADFVLIGLVLIGLAACMIAIPVLPEMLESIEEEEDLNYDPDELNDLISSLFVSSTGVGEAIGPVLSSTLIEIYGYTMTQDIYAFMLMAYAAAYLLKTGSGLFKKGVHNEPVELVEF